MTIGFAIPLKSPWPQLGQKQSCMLHREEASTLWDTVSQPGTTYLPILV